MNIGTTATVAATFVLAANALPATASPVASAAGSGGSPAGVDTGPGVVVVNELAPRAYVELRALSTVDISGFRLRFCEGGDATVEVRLALGRTLDPGEFYVVASAAFTGAPVDQTYSGVLPGDGAALLDADLARIDGAALVPDSPCGEGAPAPTCAQTSTGRDTASTDTGSNKVDFTCRPRSPGAPN